MVMYHNFLWEIYGILLKFTDFLREIFIGNDGYIALLYPFLFVETSAAAVIDGFSREPEVRNTSLIAL